ncbi:MAG: hypothetical protein AUH46_02295 [Gemmatimonadetes bacterium 13_1_40CM_70_15]|nr:MAG: hypothetical protein AUH46_02295 [Gemmatimonadetes bacterium 13_1_40CM_70_15]
MTAPPTISPRTQFGLGILGAALALGVTGDLVLRVMPWGLNVTLCAAALVATGTGLVRWRRIPVSPDAPWLALTILLLGAAFARRDSRTLAAFDVVALVLTLGLAAASLQGVRIRVLDAAGHVRALVLAAFGAALGSLPLVFRDVAWHEIPQGGRLRRVRAAALGAVLALPLLVVFGALFTGADAVFANVVSNVFALDLPRLVSHMLLIAFWAALTGGYLRFALRREEGQPAPTAAASAPGPALGIVPVATALGLIDLLFLLFVVVQARYFFGGTAVIEQTTGLTYAEYARRGFFELVTASGLALPVLLGADWLVRGEAAQHRRTFRQLAGLLVSLLAVVMASALERMRLYVAAFGLSEIRLYSTAFMGYLVVLFAWFAWTVLREHRPRFAFGALVQGFAVLAGLHVLNPDAFIVHRNLVHPGAQRPFDVTYAARLSADAVPALVAALPMLEPREARCMGARILLSRWLAAASDDWRSWNWGRARARALVRADEARLRSLACAPTPMLHPPPAASGRERDR